MTVERLNDLYYIKKRIERLDNEMLLLAERAGPAYLHSLDMTGMSRNPSPMNKSDENLKKILKKRDERAKLLLELEEIETWIRSLRHRDQLIIKYRYEDRLSWQEIADRIGGKETIASIQASHYRCLRKSENKM